jgi:ubiquinone/menaquinone biosynthesis C-methylase UbiE
MTDRETVNYYRARAPEYEQIYYRDVPERRRELDEEAERLRVLSSGKDVLDVACGTGYWTKVLSENAASVTAVDISLEMLQEAVKKSYRKATAFLQADLFRLPFRAASFDLLTLGFWFSHQPKQEYRQFFRAITHPLRPGGAIWLMDNNPPAEGPEMESVKVDDFGNNYKQRYLESGEQFIILKNYFSRDELRSIFSPHFTVKHFVYRKYYWSIVLTPEH